MISKIQANLENNHVRGIMTYTPPTYTYMGLSLVDLDDSGIFPENAEPPASTGYARLKIRNNNTSWEASENGIMTNKIQLTFPNEFTENAGIARYIFEADENGNIMYYTILDQELILYQGMTVFFNPGDVTFERRNPS